MSEVFEGTGVIETKEEAVTKKGDKYWKFTVDGKKYGLFEYEAGTKVSSGDNVKMYWHETEGQGTHGPITYRNLKSIYKSEDAASGSGVVSTSSELKELIVELQKVAVRLEKFK